MLGLIRVVLALAVLLSHVPGTGFALNPGVVAVICFYTLSGYLMRRSYERFTQHAAAPARAFLLDRVLKLYPQYLLALAATALLLAAWGPSPGFWLLQQEPTPLKLLLNALLLPANYIFGPLVITELLPHPLIPPAWSLATEFHFYLLVPLLFAFPRLFLASLLGTLALQFGSLLHESPALNADTPGYRYIVGVLPVFLMGWLHAAGHRGAWLLWSAYALLAAAALGGAGIEQPRAREVALGATLALPLLVLGRHRRATLQGARWRAWDERLGNLAYPLFITHCLAFYVVEHCGLPVTAEPRFIGAAVAVSLAASLLLERVQRHVERLRIGVRGFASMNQAGGS